MANLTALDGRGLDSPNVAVTAARVAGWQREGYRNIILNTLSPSFSQDYRTSLEGHMMVALFQGYDAAAYETESGRVRALQAVAAAREVLYPAGGYIFVDIEATGSIAASHMIDWINNWCGAVQAARYGAGAYFGVPQPLTAAEAYARLIADRYWRSCSADGITPARRACCIVQESCSGSWDVDRCGADNFGDYCLGAAL